jgi:hypothetical protein
MKPQGCAHSIPVNKNRMVTYISCLLLTQLATSWLGRKRLVSSYTRFHIDSLKNEHHRCVNITNELTPTPRCSERDAMPIEISALGQIS